MADEEPDDLECDSCGEAVSVADAVMLTKLRNKQHWKYLCPDCLGTIGVPRGYELDRELKHLTG